MNEKKIVLAVYGSANKGKTATIKEFYSQVIKKKCNIHNYEEHSYDDITALIEIQNKFVGVESQGDPNSKLFQSLDNFIDKNCDVIVCATRTKGDTVNAVNDLSKYGYEIIWFSNFNSKLANNTTLNFISGKSILMILDEFLKGTL